MCPPLRSPVSERHRLPLPNRSRSRSNNPRLKAARPARNAKVNPSLARTGARLRAPCHACHGGAGYAAAAASIATGARARAAAAGCGSAEGAAVANCA
eukprot:3652617-Prymnesium_polylepis.1